MATADLCDKYIGSIADVGTVQDVAVLPAGFRCVPYTCQERFSVRSAPQQCQRGARRHKLQLPLLLTRTR